MLGSKLFDIPSYITNFNTSLTDDIIDFEQPGCENSEIIPSSRETCVVASFELAWMSLMRVNPGLYEICFIEK